MPSYPVGFDRLPEGFGADVHPTVRRLLDEGSVLAFRIDMAAEAQGRCIGFPGIEIALPTPEGVAWIRTMQAIERHEATTPGLIVAALALQQEMYRTLPPREIFAAWTEGPDPDGADGVYVHFTLLQDGYTIGSSQVAEEYESEISELCGDDSEHTDDDFAIIPQIVTVMLPTPDAAPSGHALAELHIRVPKVFAQWRCVHPEWADDENGPSLVAPRMEDVAMVARHLRPKG